MCRLFGLTAGENRVRATFWLLDAPDSLEAQSHRNVDGAGLGYFGPDGEIVLDKQPEPAFRDQEFERAARQAESSAFVAHVRWATAGGRTCLCNGGPKCRHEHRLKQDPRWKVEQVTPGTFRWTTPSGRTRITEPTRYPT